MTTAAANAALDAGVRRVSDEAAGAVEVVVMRQIDALNLLPSAMAGDVEAAGLLQATNQAIARIQAAPRRTPLLCTSCPRPLRGSAYSVVLAVPARTNPVNAIGLAICHRCATEPDAIKALAVVGLRKIWPDLRPINVTHADGGRA